MEARHFTVFSPDASLLATAGKLYPGPVHIWDVATGKETARLTGVKGTCTALAFSPDGKTLAVGDRYGTIRTWDIETQKKTAQWTEETKNEAIESLAFSADGRWLAWAVSSHARVWDRSAGRIVASYETEPNIICAICFVLFMPDSETLVVGSQMGHSFVRLWNWKKKDRSTELTSAWFQQLIGAPGNVLVSGRGKGFRVWDATKRSILFKDEAWASSISLSPDFRTLATAKNNWLTLWDLKTGELLKTMSGGEFDTCVALAFTPNGTHAVMAMSRRFVYVFDVRTGRLVRKTKVQDPAP
jgi:WD40 repeat protein